jgi:hypothetical protein
MSCEAFDAAPFLDLLATTARLMGWMSARRSQPTSARDHPVTPKYVIASLASWARFVRSVTPSRPKPQ